ncbi:uncharacterized protein TRIADDRAFT_32617 [Trichoplax adhaerens]|uniref:Progestin and adipoQ receptor family member 3 n=1 Tax=Trichoplax adhaerens TaxID=10228 RepID=B3SB04_TRIAD|nr:hypothetical protein TRIADDRAFT_32617 [Trichoplax adhaerens]EDV20078.1 hypothetical protein TRIADDRAFT_32617 [Trichoplax adhaerens]|eukprot:XP_002117462.1 hypothetical protein TRIADDRAFT_32617 [Trichoplax adhaerens]
MTTFVFRRSRIRSRFRSISGDQKKECHGSIQLYNISQVPPFLKFNPHIYSGYRVNLSYQSCLKSLFVLSNESINIWSHFLGFFIFVYLLVFDNVYVVPWTLQSMPDRIVISSACLFYMSTLLLSTLYHLFHCHSERMNQLWLKMDIGGIGIGIIGGFVSGLYVAYYCHRYWLLIYVIVSTLLISTSVYNLACSDAKGIQFQISNLNFRMNRTVVFVIIVAFSLVPIFHFIYLHDGISSTFVRQFTIGASYMLFYGLMGCLFLVTKFPERLFPGKFDYVASSHQFWHLFVFLLFYSWHQSCLDAVQYRIKNQCEII